LYEFPNVKPVGKRGRNQVKGLRIQLRELLADSSQAWQTLTVKWYGGEQRTIECLTFECLWYHAGELPLKLRIVLVKTPGGKNEAETFFSTDITNWSLAIFKKRTKHVVIASEVKQPSTEF
jgi:hypothetical protein